MQRRTFIILLGCAVTWPLASTAQQRPAAVIGYLSSATSTTYPAALLASFRRGLSEAGYVEGKNLTIEYGWAEGDYDRLPGLAQDLVTRRVDVIAATGGIVSTRAAKAATETIPIVFTMGDDPVAAGIVASFSRPGGNITGISFFVVELGTKLLELATELIPNLTPIGVLTNPKRPSYEPIRKAVENAAEALGRKLIAVEAANDADFEPAFAALASAQAGALVITSDPLYLDRRDRLVGLAARFSIPTVCAWPDYVAVGALMSYGPSLPDVYHQAGTYVGKILAGTQPADVPVKQPTQFKLVINLKTAKALDLTVPQALLARADEVIE